MGRYPTYKSSNLKIARRLRRTLTEAERKLWSKLRGNQLGVCFRRQVPISHYVVDFYCNMAKLVVELDGSQHLASSNAVNDAERESYLTRQGLKVIRFHNNEVLKNIEAVTQSIYELVRMRA